MLRLTLIISLNLKAENIKVLYIHHVGTSGGSSTSLFNMLLGLKDKIEIHIITPSGSVVDLFRQVTDNIYEISGSKAPPVFYSVEDANFMFARLGLSFLRGRGVYKEIVDLCQKVKPDIIHLNENSLGFLAKKLSKLDVPIVTHARIAMSKSNRIINRVMERLLNRYSSKIIAISESVAVQFKNRDRITVIHNTLKKRYDIAAKRRNHSDPLVCLFLANLLPSKGLFETLEALDHLEGKNVKILIAGDNVRSDDYFNSIIGRVLDKLNVYPNCKKRLQAYMSHDSSNTIEYLGYVDNIENLFREAHLLLAPMRLNAPPRNVFESGIYGIPSILALKDKVEDVVIDNVTGRIISDYNSYELAHTILNYLNDDNLRYEHGVNAAHHCKKFADIEEQARSVINVYNSLVPSK